jgi:ribosomal protein S18 acetylase RimI-like enzyme
MVSRRDGAIIIRPLAGSDGAACDAIILSLPDHFGIEAGRQQCAYDVRNGAGFVAVVDGRVVGFLTIQQHFEAAAEITWMAVHAAYRRRGIGHALIAHLCAHLCGAGMSLLLVLTLAASDPGDVAGAYEGTRRFYRQVGFIPARELPEYWPGSTALLLMHPLGLLTL